MSHDHISVGQRVLDIEARAVDALKDSLDASFSAACDLMLNAKGRVIVTGMGKSGHVGSKLAATLASTGTPSFFVHPGEASHGDLGMITPDDVVLALSNSGETAEVLAILPVIKRNGHRPGRHDQPAAIRAGTTLRRAPDRGRGGRGLPS